jgi:hypothetical protein
MPLVKRERASNLAASYFPAYDPWGIGGAIMSVKSTSL